MISKHEESGDASEADKDTMYTTVTSCACGFNPYYFFFNFFIEGGEVYVCVGAVGVEGDTDTDSCSLWTQYQQSSVSVLPLRDTWLSGR